MSGSVTGFHRCRRWIAPVGLATVDNNLFRPPMTSHLLADEAFGGRQVTMLAKEELDGIAGTVDGSKGIHPLAAHLDVGFVDIPPAGDQALSPGDPLQQQRNRAAQR